MDGAFKDTDAYCEPVLSMEEAVVSHLCRARGLVEGGHEGTNHIASPMKLSTSRPRKTSSAPGLGEHTREIMHCLGYDGQEIDELIRENIIREKR